MRTVSEKKPVSGEENSGPEEWVDLFGDSLFCYALIRVTDTTLAEELVQETFLAALAAAENNQFRGESSRKTWLTGILKYKIMDHFREKYRHRTTTLEFTREDEIEESFDARGNWRVKPESWGGNPQEHFEQQEFMQIIVKCINTLNERQADAFRLRELDGEDTKEICKILNISATNYWVLMHRARLSMRRCMASRWPRRSSKKAAS